MRVQCRHDSSPCSEILMTHKVVNAANVASTIAGSSATGSYSSDSGPEYWKQFTSRSHASALKKICHS